jgi:hypothetical protein
MPECRPLRLIFSLVLLACLIAPGVRAQATADQLNKLSLEALTAPPARGSGGGGAYSPSARHHPAWLPHRSYGRGAYRSYGRAVYRPHDRYQAPHYGRRAPSYHPPLFRRGPGRYHPPLVHRGPYRPPHRTSHYPQRTYRR